MSNNFRSSIKPQDIPFKLPSNWTWYKWGDLIINYQQGLIRSNRELNNSGMPYLKMNNLDNNGGYNTNKLECTDVTDEEIEKYKLYKDDFLLNVRNSQELVGKTCVIRQHDFDMVFNHMLVRISHYPGISNLFINALLKIPVMRKFVDRCKQGTTTVIALYQRDLYEIPIPIPDITTQKLITSFIENLSIKIELNNRINAELEKMAKTLYDYWFVQFDFPDINGKPYKTSGSKMVWNEELKREIPEDWEVKELVEVASFIMRGISPSYIENGGICVLNQKCIRNNSINFEPGRRHNNEIKEATSRLIQYGDVLVNSTGFGTLGRVAIVKRLKEPITVVDSHITIVRSESENIKKLFLGYSMLIRQSEIEGLAEGSTGQTELSRVNLGKLKMVIPSIDLQSVFENYLNPQFQKMANNEAENEQLSSLRDWLLPMLMNGQVTVGDGVEKKIEYEIGEETRMVAEPRDSIIAKSDSK